MTATAGNGHLCDAHNPRGDDIDAHSLGCGSCDYGDDGWIYRCYNPASYYAEFVFLGGDGDDYTVPACARHARSARTHDSLKRIYSA